MMRYLACAVAGLTIAAASSAASIGAMVFDKNGAPTPNAVIHALPIDGTPLPAVKPMTTSIAQENLQFTPYVSAVTVGTSIRFPNNDKIEHHVKSFSKAKEFELKVYDKGTPPPVVFDKPGVVVVYCLLHGWMRSYVLVLETPYFGTTDTTGVGKIDDLPPGTYEVTVWHPDMGTIKKPLQQVVKVGDGSAPAVFYFDFVPRKVRTGK